MIPYSAEAFFDLLATYNSGIWPVQLTALFLSILLLGLLLFPRLGGDRIIAGFLACGWAWTGLVFLMNYLITLNWAGTYFGMVFVLQAGFVSMVGNNPKPTKVPRRQECRFMAWSRAYLIHAYCLSVDSDLVGIRLDDRPGRRAYANTDGDSHLRYIAVMCQPSADPSFSDPRRLVWCGRRHGLDTWHLVGLVTPCRRPRHVVFFHCPIPA